MTHKRHNTVSISLNPKTIALLHLDALRGNLDRYGYAPFGCLTEVSGLKSRLQSLINMIYDYCEHLPSWKQSDFQRFAPLISKLISIHTELGNLNTEFEELAFEDFGLDASILKTSREIYFANETLRDDQRRISNFRTEVEAYE